MKINPSSTTSPCRFFFCLVACATFYLCVLLTALATEEVFYGGLHRQQLLTMGASFEVTDNFPTSVDQTLSVRNLIWFSIDEDTLLKNTAFTHWVKVTIEKYNASDSLIDTETNVQFTVSYDPDEGAQYKYGYIYEFSGMHHFKVTITDKSSSFPAYMRLEGKIIIQRKYNFHCDSVPVLLQKAHADLVNSTTNSLQIGWQKQAGAEEYDLEWAFYDTLSPTITDASGSHADFDFLYRNNATRITTTQTWYDIPLIYPKGRIYWRIRGARYKNGVREMSKWTSLKGSSTPLLIRKEWYWVNPHEQGLNWQMQAVFAEEGKKSQSVTYFDGSLRNRQKAVRSDAINMIVASETIYDSLGRAALQVMPAPVSFDTGANDWTRRLSFTPSYSAALGKTHYSAVDFSFNSADCNIANTNPAAMMDTVNSAVARYYSSNNPWKNRFMNKFTPASEGFPFSVTEYMPDGTGRIRRQGGVGSTFQLGSSHETKYYYAKPDQVELDRLFGNEAGYASHYQKNVVMDPNGQISVSYIDAHGRTVATALAGEEPSNLERLSNFVSAERMKRNLLYNVPQDMALTSTYSLFVSTDGPRDTFIYTFYPKLELTIDSCLSAARCYDCKYDVEIKVVSECGDLIVDFTQSNFTAGSFDTLCEVLPDTIYRLFDLNPGLKVGQYQVTKTIKINESALNYYADDFLRHLTCLPDTNTLQSLFLGDTSCNKTCQECNDKLGELSEFRDRYLEGVTDPTSEDFANADTIYYRAKRACAELCDAGDPSDCGIMYEMMLIDVTPGGGQYADYGTNVIGPGPDSTFVYTASTDTTSVFYLATGETLFPFQKVVFLEDTTNLYRDEFGNIDYIDRPDSTRTRIDSLTLNEFITYFKPSWAKTLVKAHPEYCLYLCCKQNSHPSWDSLFSTITTYAQAVAAGYLPIDSLIANDPFFQENPTLQDSMLEVWHSYITTAPSQCSSPISLSEIIRSIIWCGGELPCPDSLGCTADNNMFWLLVQSHYLSEKSRLKWNKMRSGACQTPDPPNMFCKNYNELCFGKPTCGMVPNPYQNKVPRIFPQQAPLTYAQAEHVIYNLIDSVQMQLGNVCDTTCAGMADVWIQILSESCETIRLADSVQLAELRARFIAVCKAGCDFDHPFGSITTNGTLSSLGDYNLQDAIEHVFETLDECDENCSAKLIDFPGTWTMPQYLAPPQQVTAQDSCTCDRLEILDDCWSEIGQPSLLDYINSTSDVQITQAQLDTLQAGCASSCTFLNEAITIPPILECDRCRTYPVVEEAWNAFFGTACADTSTEAGKRLAAAHLNQVLGLNRSFEDYLAFLTQEDINVEHEDCYYLCPLSRFPAAQVDTSCISPELYEGTLALAALSYQNLLDSMRRVFVRNYLGKCLGPELVEKFEVRHSQGEYHYTLYYYDQAGNLVRTVPPKGVQLLTTTSALDSVANHRLNGGNPVKFPAHNLVTRYWYNTLNQVVRDSTPDRGDTDYWYDRLGRLVLSQNAEQRQYLHVLRYTFSRYDALGRVIETGLTLHQGMVVPTQGYIWDYDEFEDWLLTDGLIEFKEVTKTFYDDIIPGSSTALSPYFPNSDGTNGQTNLRNRVASVTFEDSDDNNLLTYNSATHYSYDVSGNVKQMLQDIPELNINDTINHRFKRIAYDYDLVSGKVNYVHYQKDSVDQFIHHYVYDADNRVEFVETSRDGLMWERDANYEYYLHGPLGRTELGERRVQGLDYAYTLQGWLKGLNASALSYNDPNTANFDTRDMGRDGKNGNSGDFAHTKNVARDVAAFTLGYYYGDYRKVNATFTDDFELTLYSYASFNTAGPSLYNGNIRHATYAIAKLNEVDSYPWPEGYGYKYDQLNRLIKMRMLENTGLNDYLWYGPPFNNRFLEDIAYDPNGNITRYLRHGNSDNTDEPVMDSLTYHYPTNNNKLTHIDDAQTDQNLYDGDLEDQAPGNYEYDAIGNLKKDVRDSISLVTWTNAQKIDVITKTDRSISFKYDPMQNRVAKYSKPNASNLEKRTYYIRDAQGNVMATYSAWVKNNSGTITWDSMRLSEQHIYGSSRVGMALTNVKLYPTAPPNPHLTDTSTSHYPIFEGWKRYEITNHLGNVLAVITDRKHGKAVSGTAIQWFDADVVATQQYYPFGMLMPGINSADLGRYSRQYSLDGNDYRYGFNGKEGDDEVKGDDNQQDYGMRIYDPRVGRFLSVDPISREYPMLTSYQFASNSPISGIDLDGLEYYYTCDGKFLGNHGTNTQVRLISESDYTTIKNANSEQINGQTVENALFNMSNGTTMKNIELLRIAGLSYGETGLNDESMRAVPNAVFNRHLYYLGLGAKISFNTTIKDIRGNTSSDEEYNDENGTFRKFIGNDISDEGIDQSVDWMKNAYGRNNDPIMQNAIKYTIDAYGLANGEGGTDYSNGSIGWHGLDILKNGWWKNRLYVKPEDRNHGFQGMPNSIKAELKFFESVFSRKGKTFGAIIFYKMTQHGEDKTALGNKNKFIDEY